MIMRKFFVFFFLAQGFFFGVPRQSLIMLDRSRLMDLLLRVPDSLNLPCFMAVQVLYRQFGVMTEVVHQVPNPMVM